MHELLRQEGPSIRVVFKVSKEFSPQELLKELVTRFKIEGINIVV